jgi:predicted ester cyclase
MMTKPFVDPARCRIAGDHRIDPGQRRRVLLQTFDEIPDLRSSAANLYFDAARIVAHPAGKAQFPASRQTKGRKPTP